MSHAPRPAVRFLAALALVAAATTACAADPDQGGGDGGGTLVVDTTFDLKTTDPARLYEPTGQLVGKAVYDTLLTYDGGDVGEPVPGLATIEASQDARTFTLTLEEGRTFSDGSEVTADDVVFSLTRVQGVKGNPSFLLDGITVTKQDDRTVVLTTKDPSPNLPAILPNPALAVLNADVVTENGGTTDSSDGAETWLNEGSAGSGPYTIESVDVASQVELRRNPEYDGPAEPGYERIVIRNVEGAAQKLNLARGDSQVALDLSGDQAADIEDDVSVTSGPSALMIFLLLNQDDGISGTTSDPAFVQAVKAGVDYESLLEVAGPGAEQASGVIPSLIGGALPKDDAPTFDLDRAKSEWAKVADKAPVTLSYPSDVNIGGLAFDSVAQRVQAQLKEVGMQVELAPAPVATELDRYRDGKEVMGLWYWGPDYPDPSSYLAFSAGDLVGLRAGWQAEADPGNVALARAARQAVDAGDRDTAYEELGRDINATGPFVPLIQPASNIATAQGIDGVAYNPVWTLDLAALSAG